MPFAIVMMRAAFVGVALDLAQGLCSAAAVIFYIATTSLTMRAEGQTCCSRVETDRVGSWPFRAAVVSVVLSKKVCAGAAE